jgi:hypothetical protein
MTEDLKSARHEAAHAVAGLHYRVPFEYVSIERGRGTLGTTRMGVSRNYHAIAVFCGPMAEREWKDFDSPLKDEDLVRLSGTDRESVEYLQKGLHKDINALQLDAWALLGNATVQEQIDRVAQALLERRRLSHAEVIEISGFVESLADHAWFEA